MSEEPKTAKRKTARARTKAKTGSGRKPVAPPPAEAKPKTRVMADPALARRHDRLPQEDAQVEVLIDSMVKARDFDFSGFFFHKGFAGFDGVRFDGHVDFSESEFAGDADFTRAAFLGGVTFEGAEFDGEALFAAIGAWGLGMAGVQAFRGLDLTGAKLRGADLSGSHVAGCLRLVDATISDAADLRRIEVGALDAAGVQADRLDLRQATVRGGVDLRRCRVSERLDLSGAALGGLDLCEADTPGAVALAAATVTGRSAFRWAKLERGVDARGARLGEVDFHSARVGVLDLRGAILTGDAHLDQLTVTDHAVFRETRFGGGVHLDNARIGGAIDFHKAQFLGEVDLHGAAIPPVGDFESVALRKGRGESFCRFARLVLQSMGLHRQSADWRFAECEHAWHARRRRRAAGSYRGLRKRGTTRGLAMILSTLWATLTGLGEQVFGRWIFGYGERPLRVLATSVGLILLCWPLYLLAAGGGLGIWEALRHSIGVFGSVGQTAWQPAPGTAAAWLQTIHGLLSPLLLILFVVTLTRRWSRG